MKIKKILSVILSLILLNSCTGFSDAIQGKKRSENSDEFLVQKKNPLTAPPDMDELPVPCLLYTSPSPRDRVLSRMPSSA